MEGEQGAVARLVLGPEWQGPRRAVPDPVETSEKPVDQRRGLMRDQVERVVHQMAVQHRDGGGASALDQMREGAKVGLLTLVQCQRPGAFDQRFGLRQETRVIGDGEHPGFPQICHGKVGRGLTRGVELTDGVAVDEVDTPVPPDRMWRRPLPWHRRGGVPGRPGSFLAASRRRRRIRRSRARCSPGRAPLCAWPAGTPGRETS